MVVYLIAEIGVNFDSLETAVFMIKQAKKAGVDAVKFQLFNEETIAESPFKDKLQPLILQEEQIKELKHKAELFDVDFILTPMYLEAVDLATKYCDNYIKIRYADHENQELIDRALATGKTLLISVPHLPTEAHKMFNPHIKWFYCVPKYPPEIEEFCLDYATVCHGFSSHFPHTICDLAFAINATHEESFIEKHVTLPLSHYFRAHYAKTKECYGDFKPIDFGVSITFDKLKKFRKELCMVQRIRRVRI